MKRLAVCCDGTWNTPDQKDEDVSTATNVTKLALAVDARSADGGEQRVYYHPGVGTGAFDHLRGGALGVGLSRNVQDAYMFVVENYDPGDEVFLFGFSRGAYTARSTAGFIRNSGLLKRGNEGKLDAAYELYRDRSDASHPRSTEAQLFRRSFSLEIRIKFIGVWDTVGALGIPNLVSIHSISNRWEFHDVTLSSYVDNAFQALAIDEHRKPFKPTLWEQQPDVTNQTIEQVWFAGVHTDVGGGYRDSGLSDLALRWMVRQAEGCGLAFDAGRLRLEPDACGQLRDSMTWYYRLLGQLQRPIAEPRVDPATGKPVITLESVAASAGVRWLADPSYRPDNLRRYRDRGGPETQA
jgi:uncharacterized protein (DUF2235 family)